LWNPATSEFKVAPLRRLAYESPYQIFVIRLHGFGYDKGRDDYKVIRHVSFHPNPYKTWKDGGRYPFWEIYSLKSNYWRQLDLDHMPTQYNNGVGVQVYTDGVCHWWGETDTHDEVYLVSFYLQ